MGLVSFLAATQRMWCLQRLRVLLSPISDVQTVLDSYKQRFSLRDISVARPLTTAASLKALVKSLPETLLKQYEYEDPLVRGGTHLLHSPFFKVIFHHMGFRNIIETVMHLGGSSLFLNKNI